MPEIKLTNVSFSYTNSVTQALKNLTLTIPAGSFTAIVGHTGSGKSTLVSLIDGLVKPTAGTIQMANTAIGPNSSHADQARLRHHVGFVFQFPEQQLFAETVAKDIAFGPENLGFSASQVTSAVDRALQDVGLPHELADRSPFMLSGGQMRRVAIAGVLAMQPEILILDEPTAGLDARSTKLLMELISRLHAQGKTIILITHQMEQVAEFADQVVVMNHGELVTQTTPAQLFADHEFLQANHLGEPAAVRISNQIRAAGADIPVALTLEQLAAQLAPWLGGTADE
ncbi:MAG: energy-coupling factor transporter ATPase [Limosilactobacillus sp.]|uniref:energy-coupling factor transporter ATPase n=1 Tax=Limosilactobacillus sp. TaxID=2773925 RepID=UPI0026F7E8D5|nr:energy-coupling factor transporter ATPase [Limosilactobacillus sp.]